MDREEADRREAGREGVNGPEPADAARPAPAGAIRLDAVVRRQGTFTLGPLDMTVPAGMVTGSAAPPGPATGASASSWTAWPCPGTGRPSPPPAAWSASTPTGTGTCSTTS